MDPDPHFTVRGSKTLKIFSSHFVKKLIGTSLNLSIQVGNCTVLRLHLLNFIALYLCVIPRAWENIYYFVSIKLLGREFYLCYLCVGELQW